MASKGPYYTIHLYAGRRRENDFHAHMERILTQSTSQHIKVISIDTAISDRMNVRKSSGLFF